MDSINKLFRKLSFTLIFLIIGISYSYSQEDAGKATINTDMLVVLDESSTLTKTYTASISKLELKDEEAANALFGSLRDNMVMFTVDFEKSIVTITIMTEYMPDWGLSDWNKYFVQKSENYLADNN